MITCFLFPLPLVHTWGFCESWPCCTVIGEEVKLFKKILKLFLLFPLCIWSISYPRTPLLLPAATWKMLWQIWGPRPSHSALQGPCCSPIYRRHPLRSPPRHTGNQKTSGANLQVGGNSHWLGHRSSKGSSDVWTREWVNGPRHWTNTHFLVPGSTHFWCCKHQTVYIILYFLFYSNLTYSDSGEAVSYYIVIKLNTSQILRLYEKPRVTLYRKHGPRWSLHFGVLNISTVWINGIIFLLQWKRENTGRDITLL